MRSSSNRQNKGQALAGIPERADELQEQVK